MLFVWFYEIIHFLPPSSKASLWQIFSGGLGFIIATSGIITGELVTLDNFKIKVDAYKYATYLNIIDIFQIFIYPNLLMFRKF